jgi:hypothetical protein
VLSNQADVKSGTDDAAASFMRARRPVFGIAYRMLGSASEASEKPAALQPTTPIGSPIFPKPSVTASGSSQHKPPQSKSAHSCNHEKSLIKLQVKQTSSACSMQCTTAICMEME